MVNGPAITATAASGAGHGIKVNDGIYVCSGNVTATAAGAGKKGVNSEAFVYVAGGTLAGSASGGYVYDSSDADYKAAAGISADGYITENMLDSARLHKWTFQTAFGKKEKAAKAEAKEIAAVNRDAARA